MQQIDEITGNEKDSFLQSIIRSIEVLIINLALYLFVVPICFVIYISLYGFDRRKTSDKCENK